MSTNDGSSRPHHVLVWGATGFTGKLVAEYLLRKEGVGRDVRWALGGRSREKLEQVRAELSAIDPKAGELPLVIGDARDGESMNRVASEAKVIATTVGPYAQHGVELLRACAEHGTHYADLTGETNFVRHSIDAHHKKARETGARLVHCCGYDSIPSDLGAFMVQEAMRERRGGPADQIKYFAGESRGGVSGGTAATMVNTVELATTDRQARRLLGNPYALDPERGEPGPDGPDQKGVRFDRDLQQWTGPFVMAAINTRVVRRTNALLDYAWGKGFRYSEAMSFGKGPKGLALASAVAAAVTTSMVALAVPPVRRVLQDKVLPHPGEGPSKEKRDSGFFVSRLVGLAGVSGPRLLGVVKGTSDPGYGETAKMLGESALCLAFDDLGTPGGTLTPAYAMGKHLLDRLRKAGMTFEVRDLPLERPEPERPSQWSGGRLMSMASR